MASGQQPRPEVTPQRQQVRLGEMRGVLFSVRHAHKALAERDLARAVRYFANAQRDLYFAIGLFRMLDATAGLRAIVTDLGWKLEDAIKSATGTEVAS